MPFTILPCPTLPHAPAGTDASLSSSLRDILTAALQELIEAELTATIGAAPGERTPDCAAQRVPPEVVVEPGR